MALNSLGLGITFSGVDRLSPMMGRLGGRLDMVGKKLTTLGRMAQVGGAMVKGGLALMAAGAAGLAGFNALAGQFGKLELQMARAGAIMQASTVDMNRLNDAAIQAGIATQFSPEEAAQGLSNLAAQGNDATDSIKLLRPALDLAAAGQISVADASAVTASAMKVFGLSVDEGGAAVDKMLRISNRTALQSHELRMGIANIARGAKVAKQGIDEMLPALGLVRNTGVDVSVAGTAVSSALQFMAKNASKFDQVGVKVTDAQGNFRPFLDVVNETQTALGKKFPDDAKRAAKTIELFGRFGSTAFVAVGDALKRGIKDEHGTLVKGEAAIKMLRESMRGAGGAAEEFKGKLLDTFAGQKVLLKGSLQTLAIVVGKPLAQAIRPMVEGIKDAANRAIAFIQKMDPHLKALVGRVLVGGAAFTALAGAVTTLAGGGVLLAPMLAKVGLALKGILVTGWPVIAVLGVLIAAFAALRYAYQNNLGGLADFVHDVWYKARVAFEAVSTLLSGKDLPAGLSQKLEALGLDGFVRGIAAAAKAVQGFLSGLGVGFKRVVVQNAGVFRELVQAFKDLGKALGDALGDLGGVGSAFEGGASAGATFGKILGHVAVLVVRVLTAAINVITGLVSAWKSVKAALSPVIDAFGEVFDAVGEVLAALSGSSTTTKSTADVFKALGHAMAHSIVMAAKIIAPVVRSVASIIRSIARVLKGVVQVIKGIVTGEWSEVWSGIKNIVGGVVRGITSLVINMADIVSGVLDSLFGTNLAASVAKWRQSALGEGIKTPSGIAMPATEAPRRGAPMTQAELQTGIRDLMGIGPMGVVAPAAAPFATPVSLSPEYLQSGMTPAAPGLDTTKVASSAAAAASEAAMSMPPTLVAGDVTLDGDQVGTWFANYQRGQQSRAGG